VAFEKDQDPQNELSHGFVLGSKSSDNHPDLPITEAV
jgi:hypothetical protein